MPVPRFPRSPRLPASARIFIRTLFWTATPILLMRRYYFDVFNVKGSSVAPTLSPDYFTTGAQDVVLVRKRRRQVRDVHPREEDSARQQVSDELRAEFLRDHMENAGVRVLDSAKSVLTLAEADISGDVASIRVLNEQADAEKDSSPSKHMSKAQMAEREKARNDPAGEMAAAYQRSSWYTTDADGNAVVGLLRIRRGQFVVFRTPHDPYKTSIKRVVAIAGDRVTPTDGDKSEAITIPFGHIWVEGEETFPSLDSNTYGPISLALVQGVATRILLPWRRAGAIDDTQGPFETSKWWKRCRDRIVLGEADARKLPAAWIQY